MDELIFLLLCQGTGVARAGLTPSCLTGTEPFMFLLTPESKCLQSKRPMTFFFSGIKVCVYVKYLQTKIRSVLKKSEALERVMNQGPDEGFDG